MCIGYNDKDLCLPCADLLVHKLKYISDKNDINKIDYNNIYVMMEQNIFKKSPIIPHMIIIDNMCLTSYPCKHKVITIYDKNDQFINNDGHLVDGITIANKYWEHLTDKQKKHFGNYLDKKDIFHNRWNTDFYR